MTNIVVDQNEIFLGTRRFPIKGRVSQSLISTFPSKVVIGDYSKDTEQVASNWIMSDWRGGLCIEEMDESQHQDRFWWSTADTRFNGNLFLAPLATSATKPSAPTAPTIVNADMEAGTGWTNGAQSAAQHHGGANSWLVATTTDAYQDLTWNTIYCGSTVTFTCWYYGDGHTGSRIGIDDGITTTYSATPSVNGAWTQASVTATVGIAATRLRLLLDESAGPVNSYFDDAAITVSAWTVGATTTWCEFNGNLYCNFGRVLAKLDTGAGASFTGVGYMPATITCLSQGVSSSLYVSMGDATNYVYMNTSEVFAQTDVLNNQYAIVWDSKYFKINTSGQISYTTAPAVGSPAFTNNGLIDLSGATIQGLRIYRDANMNEIIYARTTDGLYAHDFANAKFVKTLVTFPRHADVGKGCVVWHDALYISSGLELIKYITADTSTISSIGMNKDDGLPDEYRGAISALIQGHDEFYACVDSSLTSGTNTSGVYAYNGAWRCVWSGDSTDKTMNGGYVSSVYAYRLWFDHNNTIYYVPLNRDGRNPLKVSGSTYGASAALVTPWFDADTANSKLALRMKVHTTGSSTDETIAVKYRINHTSTAIATTWVTLGTIAAVGETTYTFGTNAGTEFREIQFRFDFARAAGTNTNTPNMLKANLVFLKLLDVKRGFNITVDCSRDYKGYGVASQVNAVMDLEATNTLSEFTFRSDDGGTYTYYVKIANAQELSLTGTDWRGHYQVHLIQP